jgi:hypothetical protein
MKNNPPSLIKRFSLAAMAATLCFGSLMACATEKKTEEPAEEKKAEAPAAGDDFAAEAKKEITKENAEAKADELEKEILADTE